MLRFLLVCSFFCFLPSQAGNNVLNVCSNLMDYFLPTPDHCWHNPDLFHTPAQIAQNHHYPFEVHEVVTQDGYVLTMFRIPPKIRNPHAPVVFLQHGMFCTAKIWLSLEDKSLAFKLSEAGFDVWLGNFRGNVFSSKHIPNLKEKMYWQFTFFELGFFDLEAMLKKVAQTTKQKIHFIGHSLGATAAFIYAIERKCEYMKSIIALAPVGIVRNENNLAIKLASLIEGFARIAKVLKFDHIGVSSLKVDLIIKKICSGNLLGVNICNVLVYIVLAVIQNENSIPAQNFPVIASQLPAGTALNVFKHLSKSVEFEGHFRHYNYDPVINVEKYHQLAPPLFDLDKVDVPVYLIYGTKDEIADAKDVTLLFESLTTEKYLIEVDYNHLDFVFGENPDGLLQALLSILENYKIF